jgi:acyl-CoA thioester hydrolase
MSDAATDGFRWRVRVYFEDTDAAGIVYYANYLKFFERCRTEWLRALGIEQHLLAQREQLQFVVVSLKTEFLRPARLDDCIDVTARIGKQARSYVIFEQHARRGDELLAAAEVKVACVNSQTLRPTALPDLLKRALGTANA